MPYQTVIYSVLAIAVLAWVIYRQMTWQLVTPSRVFRMPVIFAIIGVFELTQVKGVTTVTGIDALIVAGELVLSLGVGAAMGFMAHFRTRPQRQSDVVTRSNPTASFDPSITVIESKTGVWGAVLWVLVIAVRVGVEFGARGIDHSALISATGLILILLAANRLARGFVMLRRLQTTSLIAA
ncbi:MAG TPA: hypothetical protein VGI56_06320 [Galbitalea sp.]